MDARRNWLRNRQQWAFFKYVMFCPQATAQTIAVVILLLQYSRRVRLSSCKKHRPRYR